MLVLWSAPLMASGVGSMSGRTGRRPDIGEKGLPVSEALPELQGSIEAILRAGGVG